MEEPMGPTFDQRVEAWDRVAQSTRAQEAIAPSSKRPEGYAKSGLNHADKLAEADRPDAELTIMDFGCGDGRVTAHLVNRYGRVVGADASPAMIARLAKRAPKVEGVVWNGRDDFPVAGLMFDAICSFLMFIHYPHGDGREILAALAGRLKPGGIMAIQCPLYDQARRPVGWTSVGVWTPEQFVLAAQDAGLAVDAISANRGRYKPGAAGKHHGALQVLHRPK